MRRALFAVMVTVAVASALPAAGCGGGSSSNPAAPSAASSAPSTPASTPTPTTGTYAWTQDVKPILASDCTRCHSGSKPSAGVDLSTYTGTMRVVSAGIASSPLVLVTGSGGRMSGYLSGDRAGKAEIIRQWVLSGAPETR